MSEELLYELAEEEKDRQNKLTNRVFCCTSTACLSAGAGVTRQAFDQETKGHEDTEIVPTGCMGLCSKGPLVRVETNNKPDVLYHSVTPDVAKQIVAKHIGKPGEDETEEEDEPKDAATPHDIPHFRASLQQARAKKTLGNHILSPDIPFFSKQVKVVLTESGHINPEKLEDYLAHGGYQALIKVIKEMSPEDVCTEVLESGLRGRGGAGFPTGMKWNFVRKETGDQKYVIINGDEGDPGAYMDRTVMEDEPHRVLEGMIIAAYAVGATYGYIYIRGEYPIAIQRIRRAIRAARRRGILGNSVLGTNFAFDADVRIGAGAFVCGEETALIHSVEGKRGTPRLRPPYPSASGLWGKPTLINNVESMANIPSIIKNGAEWFANIGTEKSNGTKVFALAGQLNNTGLIEVPMGITLREIVYDIGGGIPNDLDFKAAQTGGPSGGCIPADYLDAPVDYESLKALGSIMGSGGLVIMDETNSMPEIAKFFMDFCVDESCGKCVPCRVGTTQIFNLLEKITEGKGTSADLDKLEKLCHVVSGTSLCGLGTSAPNPVLSTLRYFRDEYTALLIDESSEAVATD